VNCGIERYIEAAHRGARGDPWCAIFVNASLERAGMPGTRSAVARSFEYDTHFVGPAASELAENGSGYFRPAAA
jgi:hypothetical protein